MRPLSYTGPFTPMIETKAWVNILTVVILN